MLNEILLARVKPSDKALYNIWARKISGGWTETTLTGTLPLAFLSKTTQTLTNYKLYGTAEGAGTETESGEPTGYKLPMAVESGAQSQDIPIYIGSTKLGAEEYVDYGEQKVYKRTENLVPEIRINNGWVTGYRRPSDGYYINSNPYGEWLYYPFISIDSTVTSITVKAKEPASNSSMTMYFYNDRTFIGAVTKTTYSGAIFSSIPNGTTKISLALRTNCKTEQEIINNDYWVVLVLGSTIPAQYIPYLQPTDPPVALPEISTYSGENTLSCSEALGEVSITGYIKGE